MEKKTKIILGCFVGVAFLCFLIAFLISNNQTYTVTFDSDGGSLVSSQKIKKNGTVSKPTNPTKTGYEFIEWRLNGYKYDFTTKVTSDITLKAYYEDLKQTYIVELEVDGIKKTIEVKDGEVIELSKIDFEEKVGFEIKWYLNEEEFDIENDIITSDMVLTGKYVEVKTYTIKFDSDGGSKIEDQIVNENKKVKEPIDPTKDGYVFEGWYLNNQEYNFNDKVTSDITLKAKWIDDKDIKRYIVTFDSTGGSYVNSQKVIQNKTVKEPAQPTKKDYKFVEWQLDGKKYDFNNQVTKDIILKAVWTPIINYTVTFNSDGGTINKSVKVEQGAKVENPGSPTKSGYTFAGWLLNGRAYDFNSPVTTNLTLVASWVAIPKYTVTFNSDGGTEYPSQIIEKGGKATNPGSPTKNGYTFGGWMIGTSSFNFNTPITDNITLKAKWNEIVYTIKSSAVDQYSPDVTLSVWNGNIQVTNYRCIALSSGECLETNSIPRSFFESESSFIVILNDGTQIRAVK